MRIILAALLLPVAFASNGGHGLTATDFAGSGVVASPGGADASWRAALERLDQLAVSRQGPRTAHDRTSSHWTAVETALDQLDLALSGRESTGTGEESGQEHPMVDYAVLAKTLQDLAIGTDAWERDRLATRVAAIASAAKADRDSRPLLRALARIVEPSVLPTGAPRDAHGRFTTQARQVLERVIGLLSDPLQVEPSAFVRSMLDRIEDLGAGKTMPGFTARDVAGNELRSAELLGKVTLLRFWDPASPASIAAHEADVEFVRTFWDAPFELVGVSASSDRDEYLDFVASRSLGGMQLFDGPISIELADALAKDAGRVVSADSEDAPMGASAAWGHPAPGAVFVVDARGILRGRDLSHHGLESLVRDLIAEENAHRRELSLMQRRSR